MKRSGRGAYQNKRRRKAAKERSLRIALTCVFAIIFVYSAVRLTAYVVRSVSQKNLNRELIELKQEADANDARTEAPTFSPEPTQPEPETTPEPTAAVQLLNEYQYVGDEFLSYAKEMMLRNSDIEGWLYVQGVLNEPVLYRDNEFYLNHDFNCKPNDSGAIFLDAAHPFVPETQYLMFHGHSMYDGTMFGLLTHYKHASYIIDHGLLKFTSLYREEQYIIIGVVPISMSAGSDDYSFFYNRPRFGSDEEFDAYISRMRAQSVRDIKIDVQPSDALLGLSTCLDNDRLLVIFRRVREGEDIAQLQLQLTF